jgi:hypothetical protein
MRKCACCSENEINQYCRIWERSWHTVAFCEECLGDIYSRSRWQTMNKLEMDEGVDEVIKIKVFWRTKEFPPISELHNEVIEV